MLRPTVDGRTFWWYGGTQNYLGQQNKKEAEMVDNLDGRDLIKEECWIATIGCNVGIIKNIRVRTMEHVWFAMIQKSTNDLRKRKEFVPWTHDPSP
jgi:hypothetical protein